ncbi:unnamed protein product [Euphydryas editha]|uniref:Maturase K n=1 Tax=Euphydryas editha TaxID=104508 RepID=A0AAU9TG80_EUPED|nr:unnamed protein product [Euphydryas editha]
MSEKIIAIDWLSELSQLNTEESVSFFYNILYDLMDKYVPKRLVKSNTNFPPWYSRALIKLIRQKTKIHTRWKKYSNAYDYQLFKELRSKEKLLQKECYSNFIKFSEDKIHSSPRYFWSFIKSKLGSNSVPTHMNLNGETSTNPVHICDMFNDYFNSVFVTCNDAIQFDLNVLNNSTSVSISSIDILQPTVSKYFQQLNVNKGVGYDKVHALLISRLYEELSIPLTLIYRKNQSLNDVFRTYGKRH